MAARPKTLPAAAAPVLVGTAAAYSAGLFAFFPALAAFFGALLLQIAVNLANDYFDAKNEIDSEQRVGPVRVTQSGLIPPKQVKLAMIITLAAAALVFVYLILVGGTVIFWVAAASVLAALAYSGGPWPIASHGLGELFVFIFFGLVAVCGTYWVQARSLTAFVLLASVSPGLLISAIMMINNLRDIKTDAPAGKNTLAVKLGRARFILLFKVVIGMAYLFLLPLAIYGQSMTILLPAASSPLAVMVCREAAECSGASLNKTLAKTAQLALLFSALLAVGIIL